MNIFLPHLHTELRNARYTRKGATHHPDAVPTGLHKAYPRMEKIELPNPLDTGATLASALMQRNSYWGGTSDGTLSLQLWGTLLGLSLQKHTDSKLRNYPSGGALYPIETYIISSAVPQSPPATFHYNPSSHALEKLWDAGQDFSMKNLVPKPDRLLFSTLVLFTAVWERSSAKYGDLAFLHCLQEAGHMSENILLVATALGLQTRPMTGFNDDLIVKLLDLNVESEQPILSIVVSL